MGFRLVSGHDVAIPMHCAASSSLAKDDLACFDVSTGAAVSKIIPATSSLLSVNVAGVVQNTPATADTTCMVIPIVPGQIWEYDCTSSSSTSMLGKKNDLTNASTVANSTTISTAATAFVLNLNYVGATTDKKMQGFILGTQLPKALS